MAYYFMPIRDERDAPVDDWLLWSTYVDSPLARGTRAELASWWRTMFGAEALATLERETPFEHGEKYGSTSPYGHGRWGTTIAVLGFGLLNAGQLDRGKLRAFADAVIPFHCNDETPDTRDIAGIGRTVRSLVTPFDPAEDPEIDPVVWEQQRKQAIADFEAGYDDGS